MTMKNSVEVFLDEIDLEEATVLTVNDTHRVLYFPELVVPPLMVVSEELPNYFIQSLRTGKIEAAVNTELLAMKVADAMSAELLSYLNGETPETPSVQGLHS